MPMRRYNSFGPYLKTLYGERVYKVNVDAGFTCPNRDGTVGYGGCIYCNNDSFRPSSCRSVTPIEEQISRGITYLRKRYRAEKFIVYFQPYTNTYAPLEKLETLYRKALEEPAVVGLAIGTRPDCVDKEKIRLLEDLARDYFILVEYGLQSIYDRTLEFINRGHNYRQFLEALEMTSGRGIRTGAHIIVGFPTETREEMLGMADLISGLPLEFLKIHQLQIIKDTILERLYRKDPFPVFGYDEYIQFVIDFLEMLRPSIVIQRLFATAPDDILIAPRWNVSRHAITRDIEKKMEERDTWQGKKYETAGTELLAQACRSK